MHTKSTLGNLPPLLAPTLGVPSSQGVTRANGETVGLYITPPTPTTNHPTLAPSQPLRFSCAVKSWPNGTTYLIIDCDAMSTNLLLCAQRIDRTVMMESIDCNLPSLRDLVGSHKTWQIPVLEALSTLVDQARPSAIVIAFGDWVFGEMDGLHAEITEFVTTLRQHMTISCNQAVEVNEVRLTTKEQCIYSTLTVAHGSRLVGMKRGDLQV